MDDILAGMAPPRGKRAPVSEFLTALSESYTYSPFKNPETLFGFLWGIPVPIFMLVVHFEAVHLAYAPEVVAEVLRSHLIFVFFMLHPILFAIVFGAHGTMRAHRDALIEGLLGSLEKRNAELQGSNERLAEVDRLKTEFLANVTHELKSPLVTAIGYNERITGGHLGPVTDKQRNALEVSKRNLTRLRMLIGEIMDFSRLEAGVVHFEKVPVRLDQVVGSVIENMTLKASERKIRLVPSVPPQGATVLGDQQKLVQVVTNLVDNAIKFSHDGGTIHVSVAAKGAIWRLDVADTGCGIPAESIPKLFERFQQVDGSRARNYEGIGLGLVVAKKIVEAHGGKVWIESRVGVGTTLHVELPLGENSKAESKA